MARKKQRETYGNGSISAYKRNGEVVPDRWRISITLGRSKDGKRKRITKVVNGSLEQARKVCKALVTEYESVDFEAAQDTFEATYMQWHEMMKSSNVANPQLLNKYKRHLSYMAQTLGQMPIIEIKPADIEKALHAVKSNRKINSTTLNEIFSVTKRVFRYAVDKGSLIRNPCNGVIAPRINDEIDRRALSADDCSRLYAILDRDEAAATSAFLQKETRAAEWHKLFGRSAVRGISALSGLMAIRLMLATGIRRGEACGLTWSAVDFKRQQIVIKQSLRTDMTIKNPKTAAGVRALYVDADTMQHLKAWKEFQARAMHRIKADSGSGLKTLTQTEQTPVVCSDTGSWHDPNNLNRWWRDYRANIGYPDLKMHELRHTQATLLLGNGADVKTVQTRLGHSKASMTLDQYAHAIPANDKAAADLFGQILSKPVQLEATVIPINKTA